MILMQSGAVSLHLTVNFPPQNINCGEKLASLVHQKKPCDGEDEESHGDDVGQAEQNEEGPGNEKGGDGSGLNEEGVDDGMQMDFGNDKPCVSPAQFDGGDNPPMDDDEPL